MKQRWNSWILTVKQRCNSQLHSDNIAVLKQSVAFWQWKQHCNSHLHSDSITVLKQSAAFWQLSSNETVNCILPPKLQWNWCILSVNQSASFWCLDSTETVSCIVASRQHWINLAMKQCRSSVMSVARQCFDHLSEQICGVFTSLSSYHLSASVY